MWAKDKTSDQPQVNLSLSRSNSLKYQPLVSRRFSWDRIHGRNPDKSLKSFPPCYSQSPLQHCLEIYISSNSRNLLQFLQFSYCTYEYMLEYAKCTGREHWRTALRRDIIYIKPGSVLPSFIYSPFLDVFSAYVSDPYVSLALGNLEARFGVLPDS
jgi:hypothetical protein